jgi:hypothetical protein
MQLEKAWDLAALKEDLVKAGLPEVEMLAEKIVKSSFEWTRQSLALEGGLKAAVGLPLLAFGEPMVQQLVDKIDGQPG